MESIGQSLKTTREERGLSLDYVHDATKITVQNLAALEEDRFDYFPNRVYARAFLRDYANFLDLDSGALLAQYEEQWGAGGEARSAPPARRARRGVGYALIVLIVLAGVGAAGYFGWQASRDAETRTRRPARVSLAEKFGRPAPAAAPGGARPAAPRPQPSTVPPAGPPASSERLTLGVTAVKTVWVRIIADGRTVFMGMLGHGRTRQFEADKTINIRAGMAGAVRLTVNGKPEGPLGSFSEVGDRTYYAPRPAVPAPVPGSAPPSSRE